MAVVQQYGKGFRNPSLINLPAAVFAEGRHRVITSGIIAVTNGDSIGSKHYFGKLPSHAIIMPWSVLTHGAITGLTDYDIGLEDEGVVVDSDILADGLTLAAGGTKSPIATLTVANGIGRRLWEVLGLPRDPGIVYDVVGLMNAAATATANLELHLAYVIK